MTTTTMHDAFLAAIIAEPDRDDLRLIFCDWLEEQGDTGRAAFIHHQIETEFWECTYTGLAGDYEDGALCRAGIACSRCERRRQEREMLLTRLPGTCTGDPSTNTRAAARYVWAGPVAKLYNAGDEWWRYRRGFISSLTCTAADWLQWGPAIVRAQPIEEVRLTGRIWSYWVRLKPYYFLGAGDDQTEPDARPRWTCKNARGGLRRADGHRFHAIDLLRLEWPTIKTWQLPESRPV